MSALKLKDGDELLCAGLATVGVEIVIATSGGRLLRFHVDELPIASRTTLGDQALRLHKQEQLVGFVTLHPNDNLILVSQSGYGKRIPVSVLRPAHPGDIGTHALQLTTKTDALVAIAPALAQAEVSLLTDANRAAHLEIETIPLWGKEGPGDRVLKANRGEKIIAVTVTPSASNLEDS